jgi:hypothetical protein
MLGGVCRWRRCVCWVLFVDGGGAYVAGDGRRAFVQRPQRQVCHSISHVRQQVGATHKGWCAVARTALMLAALHGEVDIVKRPFSCL